jgi:hypothetical protein
MYWETLKIGVITIGIIVVLHLLLQIMINREDRRNVVKQRLEHHLDTNVHFSDDVTEINNGPGPLEEDIYEEEEKEGEEPSPVKYDNLKNELKEWMQKETSNSSDWTSLPQAPALVDCNGNNCETSGTGQISGEPPSQVTSIDSIFEKQSVNSDAINNEVLDKIGPESQINIPENSFEKQEVDSSTKIQETENVNLKIAMVHDGSRGGGYKNTMNQGNLGSGLNAWDTMESSYASI